MRSIFYDNFQKLIKLKMSHSSLILSYDNEIENVDIW